jgi:hypothetical protein
MINNRWLVELLKEQAGNNSAIIKSNWLDVIDNASSWAGWWHGSGHWQDTHLYSPKQIRERTLEAYRKSEERHQKWLESREEWD